MVFTAQTLSQIAGNYWPHKTTLHDKKSSHICHQLHSRFCKMLVHPDLRPDMLFGGPQPESRHYLFTVNEERTAACCVRSIWWRECRGVGRGMGVGEDTTGHTFTAQRYISDILHPTVLPLLQQQPCGVIYQHNNAISIEPQSYKSSLEPSTCCRGVHPLQTCPE